MLRITFASSRARNPFRLVAASRVNADFFFRFLFLFSQRTVRPTPGTWPFRGGVKPAETPAGQRPGPNATLRKDRQVQDRRPDPVGTSILAGIPHGGFPGRHHWGKRVTGARDLSGLFLTSR